jgi:hypothetical protein
MTVSNFNTDQIESAYNLRSAKSPSFYVRNRIWRLFVLVAVELPLSGALHPSPVSIAGERPNEGRNSVEIAADRIFGWYRCGGVGCCVWLPFGIMFTSMRICPRVMVSSQNFSSAWVAPGFFFAMSEPETLPVPLSVNFSLIVCIYLFLNQKSIIAVSQTTPRRWFQTKPGTLHRNWLPDHGSLRSLLPTPSPTPNHLILRLVYLQSLPQYFTALRLLLNLIASGEWVYR